MARLEGAAGRAADPRRGLADERHVADYGVDFRRRPRGPLVLTSCGDDLARSIGLEVLAGGLVRDQEQAIWGHDVR